MIPTKTHQILLIKNNNSLEVTEEPLTCHFEPTIQDLIQLFKNKLTTRIDLQRFIQNSDLMKLYRPYCHTTLWNQADYLPLSNHGLDDLKESTQKYDKFDQKLKESGLSIEAYQSEIQNLHERGKKLLVDEIQDRSNAYNLLKAYEDISQRDNIIAYSHAQKGVCNMVKKITSEFKVQISTNFGYGDASTFFVNIWFREQKVLAYDEWMKYHDSDADKLSKFSKKFSVSIYSWINSLNFCKEITNTYLGRSDNFVRDHILGKAIQMVDDLESLIQKKGTLEVQTSEYNPNRISLNDEELILYKIKKITGALSFVESIDTMLNLTDNKPDLVEKIYSFNRRIYEMYNNYEFSQTRAKYQIDKAKNSMKELHDHTKLDGTRLLPDS